MTADRFSRTRLLFGQEGLNRLQSASVMVVGCGAVGGFALEALVRAGVGHLIAVDFDVVSASNINRQLLATSQTIGQKKTFLAMQRVKEIAPDVKMDTLDLLVNAETLSQIADQKVDFVIDAIDALNPKTLLIEMLMSRKIPFISAMGAALKTEISKIRIARMDQTKECPLAFFVRKRLRRRGVSLNFPVVFSDESISGKDGLAWPPESENTFKGGRMRHEMGSLVTITGTFGLMCAHYALMYLKENKHE